VLAANAILACDGAGPSPTSAPLVFGSQANIFTVALDGKSRQQLTKVASGALARDPAWSPDGTRIVYAYTPPARVRTGPGGELPLPVTDLIVMRPDGAGATVLVAHDAPGAAYESPVWAPDGSAVFVSYIALVTEGNVVTDQTVGVARVPLGGGSRQMLYPNATSPTVSPDGRRLALVSNDPDGRALLVADTDGRDVRTLVPPGRLDGLAAPRFSPDGSQIAFSAFSTALAAVPAARATPAAPPSGSAAATTQSLPAQARRAGDSTASAPVVTPARALESRPASILTSLVSRTVRAHGAPMDVFAIHMDGTNLRQLTHIGEDNPAAAWGPDAQRLAILAGGGVYTLNADGTDLRKIDPTGGHGSLDWKRT
jgi:Tol biopolymer transport system component